MSLGDKKIVLTTGISKFDLNGRVTIPFEIINESEIKEDQCLGVEITKDRIILSKEIKGIGVRVDQRNRITIPIRTLKIINVRLNKPVGFILNKSGKIIICPEDGVVLHEMREYRKNSNTGILFEVFAFINQEKAIEEEFDHY